AKVAMVATRPWYAGPRAGVVAAERRAGRLDPPLLVLLDEAANICRIGDLPQLYSHLGSRGIVVLTILQSYAQGVAVWGQTGMRALWSAATVKIVGPGMDDADFAEELSRLIGDHDVAVDTHTASQGSWSRSRSPRQQRVLPASAIRALPRGRALVWSTGAKVAMVATRPWYAGPRAGEIDAARRAAEAAMTTAATAAADPAARPAADLVRSSP
ncbi:MAG TPA: TraG/TraD/VirD4 family protein, partial [Kineosporiaceae bacterium]|nr:TraG/TraD/VirD4 family protein [Kineosporiaceae bacterium]